ncbi:hypothetical protein F66182_11387, partial [Fusarium sp. NRRL 66182]
MSGYYNQDYQHQPGAGQQGYGQGYPDQYQHQQQQPPQHQYLDTSAQYNHPPPPRSASGSPYPPQEGYGYGHPQQHHQQQQQGYGYDQHQQPPPYESHQKTGTAHEYYNSHDNNVPRIEHQSAPDTTDPSESGERGLGGGLLGGAAGMFAGHKVNHGLLGTIGGAIMGTIPPDMVVALDLVALDHLYLGMGPLMRGADRIMDTTSINIMKDGIIGILRGRRIIRIDQGEG